MFPEICRNEVFRIETPRLWLRWAHPRDAATIAAWAGLPEVATMTASWPVGISAESVAERIARIRAENEAGQGMAFAMTVKSEPGRAFGHIGVHINAHGHAGVGYHLDPAFWGRGLTGEALVAMIDMTRLLTDIPKLEAGVRVINPAHIAERQVTDRPK